MKKNDAIGIGVSLLVHVLGLGLLALLTTGALKPPTPPEEPPLIEIEFGMEAEGRAGRTAQPASRPAPEVERPPVKKVELPKEKKPVRAPEKVRAPKAERVAPEEPPAPPQTTTPAAQPPSEPAEQGTPGGGSGGSAGGAGTGSQGTGASAYDMEGLGDRTLIRNVKPRNVDQARAVIVIEFTVKPDGSVVNAHVTKRGSTGNQNDALAAVKRWRFNALPANAPQLDQDGEVTFRFTLD